MTPDPSTAETPSREIGKPPTLPPRLEQVPARPPSWPERVIKRVSGPPASGKSGPSLVVCLALGSFAAALCLFLPDRPFNVVDWKLYDIRMRWRNAIVPQPISDHIHVIGVDERDYYIYENVYESEIHTRWVYAKLLETLRPFQVESVVFDYIFTTIREQDDIFANNLRDVAGFLGVGFRSKSFPREPSHDPPEDFIPQIDRATGLKTADDAWNSIENLRDYMDTLERFREGLVHNDDPATAGQIEATNLRMAWIRFLIDAYLESYFIARYSRSFEEGMPGNPFEADDVDLPSPSLIRSCAGAGFINVEKGEDEVLRRVPLLYSYRNRLFPSLDLLVVLRYYGTDFEDCRIEFGRAIEFPIRRNGSGDKHIPIDNRGQYLVNFRGAEEFLNRTTNRTLSFYIHPQHEDLRAVARLENQLRDSIILVGETAQGSTDVQPIPLSPLFPLVGVHANVLDNILKDDYVRVAPRWVESVVALVLGGVLGLFFARYDSRVATRLAAGVVIIYLLAQFGLFLHADNLVLPIARILATVTGSYIFLALYTVGVIERDRRLVKDVFLKTVSPRIGEEILRRYNDPSLWASRRAISVLFVDIRGFTPLSESLEPDQLVDLLDAYYDTVSEIVFRYDGQVNKFIGDAVMALYGALPGEASDHANRAVQSAIEIQVAIKALNQELEARGYQSPLRVGVGVNTGDVVVGAVGKRKIRIEYTALGDTVNTAERLQGQASAGKIYVGGETLNEVRRLLGERADAFYRFTRVEGLTLKGKTRSVDAYEVLFDPAHWPPSAIHTPEINP